MEDRYNVTLGFYEPSVFHIFTRGTKTLSEIDKWEEQQVSTFLHEYIHFLQDILSVKGMQNLYIIGEYLRFVTVFVKHNNHKIKLPIIPYFANLNVGNNWKISYYTQGGIDYSVTKFVSFTKDTSIQLKDDLTGNSLPIERIIVYCQSRDGRVKPIIFGTIQIMEGMAKMIQDFAFPPVTRTSPYNPYYIAIDVANDIMAGLGNNSLTMIAIFDYALQSSNPGWAFVRYIKEKKSQGYTAATLTHNIVYDDLIHSHVLSNTQGFVSFIDGYKDAIKQSEGVFKEYLGNVWFFKNIENWYCTLLERGVNLRGNFPYLFVCLAQDGDIRKDGLFKEVLNTFGTPVVTNRNHDFDFKYPKNVMVTRDELMNVYAMMQIHRVFRSKGVFTCPLRKYCQQQPCGINKQRVDVRCVKAPWKRMRKYNRCLFNIWWKFKGFKDVEFV